MSVCQSVCWSLPLEPVRLKVCILVFSEVLHSDRNLETGKSDGSGFSREILVKWAKRTQSGVFNFHIPLVLRFAGRNLK